MLLRPAKADDDEEEVAEGEGDEHGEQKNVEQVLEITPRSASTICAIRSAGRPNEALKTWTLVHRIMLDCKVVVLVQASELPIYRDIFNNAESVLRAGAAGASAQVQAAITLAVEEQADRLVIFDDNIGSIRHVTM